MRGRNTPRWAFTEELLEAGIAGSIGTVGDALDNALMKSTIGLYQTALVGPGAVQRTWTGFRELERETAERVRRYNTERLHSSIDYRPPMEWEVRYTQTLAQQGEAV